MGYITIILVRSSVDRRGEKVTGGPFRNDDYYRIRIVYCLLANKEQNRSQMLHNAKFGLNRLERGRLTIILEKMQLAGWIRSFGTKYDKSQISYILDEKALMMVKTIQEFDDSHPIFDFETFNNLNF